MRYFSPFEILLVPLPLVCVSLLDSVGTSCGGVEKTDCFKTTSVSFTACSLEGPCLGY